MNSRWLLTLALSSLLALNGCGGKKETEKKGGSQPKPKQSDKNGAPKSKKDNSKQDSAKKDALKKDGKKAVSMQPAPDPILLPASEVADGWISLFDGVSLFGWKAESDADWRVEDNTIVVSQGERGLLRTTTSFTNYTLKLEFKSEKGTNSGIFLHTPAQPKDPKTDCYELNIADADNPFPTGSFVGRQKVEGNTDSADWQSYEVDVDGGHLVVKLDGKTVMNFADSAPLKRGYIGLQLNSGKVAFRNIRLKPKGQESMFNGKDLAGWKTYPNMKSKFSVTNDGLLNVKDGKGQLETAGSYGDFVLQLECITHAAELNSGIFFRCIPGDEMMGYESQIHNGFKDDRNVPRDYGTGGIFRRQKARRVVADDNQWFHKTLIVDGPHIAVWVNGHQVSDWTDDRKPNENPRRGLRLKAGTIMIQGHDETTNISFRNMTIKEMPKRQD